MVTKTENDVKSRLHDAFAQLSLAEETLDALVADGVIRSKCLLVGLTVIIASQIDEATSKYI